MKASRLQPAGGFPTSELAQALAQARRDLPPGPPVERLRNYCGRVWDVLCAPAFSEADGRSLERGLDETARGVIETCLAEIHRLLAEGASAGQFRPQSCGPAARLLVASLLARALWCAHGVDTRIAGPCTRVVAEMLDLVLPAVRVAPPRAGT